MRSESFHAEDLARLLRRTKIATMPELKKALGTAVDVTVFRKLQQLAYRTSYSHRGSYYTLEETARFDENGLWSFHAVWFSRQGTLLATAEAFVEGSEGGYFAEELGPLLHVATKAPLLRLVQQKRIARQTVGGLYLYCSIDPARRQRQLLARRVRQARPDLTNGVVAGEAVSDELKAAIVLFLSTLGEKQRRLYAGLESLKLGYGGDQRIAEFIGMDPHTVAKGRRELLEADWDAERIRQAGGGAPAGGKKTPEVIARIEALLQHDTAGDPLTGVKWSRRTTRKIAEELATLGITVSKNTVGRLLKDLDYKLRVNRKQISSSKSPVRNQQFLQIGEQRQRFACQGLPIISVDSKKKELIGAFKNPGAKWDRQPHLVKDHDFRSEADALATPRGIYDTQANRGAVFVGISHDTPTFAVDTIAQWWLAEGRVRYPQAGEILILADGGGSNGPRCRAWKKALQDRICNPFGLTVTVSHYPPGTSKWNPIEHRLFSEISKNWAAQPLLDLETMLNFIRTTQTQTGLTVTAYLIPENYAAGIKISDQEMRQLHLVERETLGCWNYSLHPYQNVN